MSRPASRVSLYSPTESIDYTPLQLAALYNEVSEIRRLVTTDIDIDIGPDTALHLSLRKRKNKGALILLEAGADFEIRDSHEDLPIHIACKYGLLKVVHRLCALGCRLEVQNARGLYPLHLAARSGHMNVVRCLCVAGCNLNACYSDNIRADVSALKYGHNDIAELLDKLRATGQRDVFARQLVPTSKPAVRLSLRVLGHCGVGKTALIKSLSAGLFSSLFRRSGSLQSNKSRPSSPITTQIEMNVTSRQNSLTFESSGSYESTKGIDIQNVEISSVGEVMVWEFPGQENYFPVYHHFLRSSCQTLTLILFNLEDPPVVQVKQVCFWMNFIMARSSVCGPVALVATHVDLTRAIKSQSGEWLSPDAQKTQETLQKKIPTICNLQPSVIVMDANIPASYPFKQIKSLLVNLKQDCIEKTIGTCTGLLDHTLSWLTIARKDFEQFPVLCRDSFYDILRTNVNLLASDDDIQELLGQLERMSEVFCVRDKIVLSVPWLGSQLIGELLSSEFYADVRSTGVYTADDFQAYFNQCDALSTLELLQSLNLCTQCEVDGEVEYEFPIYNQTETLPGLWDSADPRYRTTGSCYGGVRLCTPPKSYHMLTSIFPLIQVGLRQAVIQNFSDTDTDLYQWYQGSKLCTIVLETLITLSQDTRSSQFIEVKIRGPRQTSQSCFQFFETVLEIINLIVAGVCPGLILERHILSVHQLRIHSDDPYCYPSNIICDAMLNCESTLDIILENPLSGKYESLVELVLFDEIVLAQNIDWGCVLKVCDLSSPTKLNLGRLLDPPEAHGRDWCLLALRLGLEPEIIVSLDSEYHSYTMRLLSIADCTIGALIATLHDLGRSDAAEVVLRSAPLLKVLESDSC